MPKLLFDASDLQLELPTPGWYPARIHDTRWRRSPSGNRMLQVVYAVAEVQAPQRRLAEYFVLEGTTAFGLNRTRRRLADLFRAAGLDPKAGEEISPSKLRGLVLDVELEHETWRGEPRLAVVGHRPHRETQSGLGFPASTAPNGRL